MLYEKRKWMALVFLIPFIFFAIAFLIVPFISNFYNAFFQFEFHNDQNPDFVGWENFKLLFKDDYFWVSFGNTFILIGLIVVFQIGIALLLALLVNSLKKVAQVYRVVFFIPVVISGTVLGTMFLMFGNQHSGLFNQILALIGIEHGSWLPSDNRFASLSFVMLPIIWQYIGFYFVILLTGLTNISDDIIEAAKIDGASGLKSTVFIVLPMLWNVFRTCIVLAITGALKVYDVPQVIAPSGSPAGFTYFMGTYNSSLFNLIRLGENAIYSIIIVIVGVLVSQLANAVLRENKDI